MATVEGIIKCGQLIKQAINLIDSGANPRATLVQAYSALVDAPPAPPPPTPTDMPGVVLLHSGPYAGMMFHEQANTVLPEAQMRDYVARLAKQWTGTPPGWEQVYRGLQAQDGPQEPPKQVGETPL